jgi:hypothetical protein
MMIVITTDHRTLIRQIFTVLVFVLLLAVLAPAQRPTSLWYYPAVNATGTERGDFNELKNKHRVFVSFFHGSTPTAYQRILEQQVFEQLRQYPGLERVNSPALAELAIHIRVTPINSKAVERMPATEGPAPVKRYDTTFYVLTKGMKHGEDIYNPRLIVRRQHMEGESSTTAVLLEVSSFIERLKRLQAEK